MDEPARSPVAAAISLPVASATDETALLARRRKNARLVYGVNFTHVLMMTICLGPVFDQYLYCLSTRSYTLVDAPTNVSQGNLVQRAGNSFEEFELHFDVNPAEIQPTGFGGYTNWLSLVHLTTGGDCCAPGERIPAVFFEAETRRIVVAMDRASNPSDKPHYDKMFACRADSEIPADRWSHVKVKLGSSSKSKGEYDNAGAVTLSIDGVKVCSNGAFQSRLGGMSNGVKVYVGDPWHQPAVAQVRSLTYGAIPSNTVVGLVESVRGCLGLLLAIPLGVMSDRYGRIKLARWNMLVAVIAAALLLSLLVVEGYITKLIITLAGVCFFAAYQQCLSGALTALLADSVDQGDRARSSARYKVSSSLGMAFGPALQLIFLLAGAAENEWSMETTELLNSVGWVLLPVIAVGVWSFDPGAADAEAERLAQAAAIKRGTSRRISQPWLEERVFFLPRRVLVPLATEVFFFLTLLANGMTIRFLSLYFAQSRKFSPIQICLLTGSNRLVIALTTPLIRRVSGKVGRANLVVLLHVLSAVCILLMIQAQSALWAVVMYFGRYIFLQGRDPILTSIVMDTADPRHRGRWAQVASLRTLSFSGSAFVGGWLADRYGYEFSFYITFWVLMLATVSFLPVLMAFPRTEGRVDLGGQAASSSTNASGSTDNGLAGLVESRMDPSTPADDYNGAIVAGASPSSGLVPSPSDPRIAAMSSPTGMRA